MLYLEPVVTMTFFADEEGLSDRRLENKGDRFDRSRSATHKANKERPNLVFVGLAVNRIEEPSGTAA